MAKEISFEDFGTQEAKLVEKTGETFSEIYNKYYPKLVYFTGKICNDPQTAEDISTDAFMQALQKIDMYDNNYQFSTWLFTIAKNITLQDLKNKKTVSMDVEYDTDGTSMKDFIEDDTEEVKDYQIHDIYEVKAKIMKDRIKNLKEPYKTVITMRELDKMAYKDISEQLGRNLSTIKSQIKNGRSILIKQTQKDFEKIDNMYL
jgi:RNA polymerase sigma factor (sigma-70 family)